jgi:hypothetical protein
VDEKDDASALGRARLWGLPSDLMAQAFHYAGLWAPRTRGPHPGPASGQENQTVEAPAAFEELEKMRQ